MIKPFPKVKFKGVWRAFLDDEPTLLLDSMVAEIVKYYPEIVIPLADV